MAKKNEFKCPKCGSPVKAWADLDAQVTFTVTAAGKLTKPVITNSYQTDGRSGVDCTECDWRLHLCDMSEDSPFEALATSALEAQEAIEFLSAKRQKSE
jgi:transcription initiation factor IIE alpha subunit